MKLCDAKYLDIKFCAPISKMLANRNVAKQIVVNKGIITLTNYIQQIVHVVSRYMMIMIKINKRIIYFYNMKKKPYSSIKNEKNLIKNIIETIN